MSIGFLFPGQGAQRPGMFDVLPDHPAVKKTFEEANDELNQDVTRLAILDNFKSGFTVQMSLFVVGVASARFLREEGIEPFAVAGLSVGAFAAAVTSGTLDFAAGIHLVKLRAELMDRCFPSGYGLSVIAGVSEQEVLRIVAEAFTNDQPVYIGIYNAPEQFVIAGSYQATDRVLAMANRLGARKAEHLNVPVPSHCPLMSPVAEALQERLAGVQLKTPSMLYVGNVRARTLKTANDIAEDLWKNVAHSVRWYDSVRLLVERGCTLFIEMSPGSVLTNLAIEAFPSIAAVAMERSSLRQLHRLAAES